MNIQCILYVFISVVALYFLMIYNFCFIRKMIVRKDEMSGKNYVQENYQREVNELVDSMNVAALSPISLRLPIYTVSLLDALCDRFGDSRSSAAAMALHDFSLEAFSELSADDRLRVATKADSISKTLSEKAGVALSADYFTDIAKKYNDIDSQRKEASS